MFGCRSRAASFASRWNRATSSSSETRRNLMATQRVSFLSQAFQTAPMPPLPICLTRMYWPSWRVGSSANAAASAGTSSRRDLVELGGFFRDPPWVRESDLGWLVESDLIVGSTPEEPAAEEGELGGLLVTSTLPFSSSG